MPCRCWINPDSSQTTCDVLFEEQSMPLLRALKQAQSKNVRFSHCTLAFGEGVPLRSDACFASNATDPSGEHNVL